MVEVILEGYDLDERDRKLLAAIDALLERRLGGSNPGYHGPPWDNVYKGDEFWLEFRGRALQLIKRLGGLCYNDIQTDPWFQTEGEIQQSIQWDRAVSQHLVKNEPGGPDGLDLLQFKVGEGSRSTKWLTRKDWLHCAILEACKKDGVEAVGRVLRRYEAGSSCAHCKPEGEDDGTGTSE